jgi:hypothetical protein
MFNKRCKGLLLLPCSAYQGYGRQPDDHKKSIESKADL